MDSAPLTSSSSDHSCHNPVRVNFTSTPHRPPLFPQTSFDGVNNLKARSSTPGLVSILLSSSLPSNTYAVTSYSWTPSSIRSFSTSGDSSSYLSEVHTPSSNDDDDDDDDDDNNTRNDPNNSVVGSSCSDSSTEGTDIFWSLDSPTAIANTQLDSPHQSDPHGFSSALGETESARKREVFANAINRRLQDPRFIPTNRRFSVESIQPSTTRPRLRSEVAVRESVEIGKCPLTGSSSLPTLSTMMTKMATDIPITRPKYAPLVVRPSEVETGGSQNLFYLSILKLLSIPSASASTFASPSASSTWAAIQPRSNVNMPVPVPSQSTSRSRLVDPEESFHSSLPLLLLSPGPTAQKDVVRPGFPALKPHALVRFVVQLEMIRQGKILKGKGHKSWDRILVWKHDRGTKQLRNSRLRWEIDSR
ncbi:hypothetical protein [Phaffia rhodozyma]|uniref:Uncharacterized protein n=1 Tax=Phaffia rhodozyma TaxID=264483 RepID=A0A0F7SK85_PHARH|nr:hypothetical protein [Phaffia rhodozyma]